MLEVVILSKGPLRYALRKDGSLSPIKDGMTLTQKLSASNLNTQVTNCIPCLLYSVSLLGGVAVLNSLFGEPKRAIVYSNVNCRGTETELRDCAHNRLYPQKMDGDVAGVRCSPGKLSQYCHYYSTILSF